jgi:hypothetical protein
MCTKPTLSSCRERGKVVGLMRRSAWSCVAVSLAATAMCGWSAPSVWAGGDANEAACPNAGMPTFRTYLPDCRAYEMVSSRFKSGREVGLYPSSDGARLLEATLGAHAGTESNLGLESLYELHRGELGWQAQAISPPAAQLSAQIFVGASADLSKTLWVAHTPAQSVNALDIYVREPSGQMVKVGAEEPPSAAGGPPAEEKNELPQFGNYTVAGASADLSHVLFQVSSHGVHWPGDTSSFEAGTFSLYEYTGTGNVQPRLVGLNGAGHLISDCETSLGSARSHELYNAVSADGHVVYFTALGHSSESECSEAIENAPEVTEVYARLDGVESVSISEPSRAQCEACDMAVEQPASEGGARRPAIFSGASRDGSKAFFLSEQELFAGNTTDALYEYDFSAQPGHRLIRASSGSSTPQVLGVARVAEDGSHAYFVAEEALTGEPNAEGHVPEKGQPNLYVFERDARYPAGHVAFIATLSVEDAADWNAADERPVQTTPDGRYLVFQSVAPLTAGAGAATQVFEYDALTEQLARISVGQSGYASGEENADLNGSTISAQSFQSTPLGGLGGLSLSSDGRTIVFNNTSALTPEAETAGAVAANSVYEYHSTATIGEGHVYLISSGSNPVAAAGIGVDASGANVFFIAPDPIVGEIGDSAYDIFDARVGGGFEPAPNRPDCTGEDCLEAATSTPTFEMPASVATPGRGNVLTVAPPVAKPPSHSGGAARARALARALRACRRLPRAHRARCKARARKHYGATSTMRRKAR